MGPVPGHVGRTRLSFTGQLWVKGRRNQIYF
jgi:hypothetical protein